MSVWTDIIIILACLAYGWSACSYTRLMLGYASTRDMSTLAVKIALGLNLIWGLLVIGTEGFWPVETLGGGILFCVFMLALFHFISEKRAPTHPFGAFTMIPVFISSLVGLSAWKLSPEPIQHLDSPMLLAHVLLSLCAYSCVTVAFMLSMMYLILHHRLKKRQFDFWFQKLPSLEPLDRLSPFWLALSLLQVLFAYGLAMFWQFDQTGTISFISRGTGTLLLIGLGSVLLLGRWLWSLRGKIYALLSISCFAVVLLVNIFIHGYNL